MITHLSLMFYSLFGTLLSFYMRYIENVQWQHCQAMKNLLTSESHTCAITVVFLLLLTTKCILIYIKGCILFKLLLIYTG